MNEEKYFIIIFLWFVLIFIIRYRNELDNRIGNRLFLLILIWKLNGYIDWGIFYCVREIVMNLCVNVWDGV